VRHRALEHFCLDTLIKARPTMLRDFDQIAMKGADLLEQAINMIPLLQGKSVVFIGDDDGMAVLIGLLHKLCRYAPPKRMMVLDFDDRIIQVASLMAQKYGFSSLLDARLYNVFDHLPDNLSGQFDVFYTNPPYGASNEGTSGQLFISRGIQALNIAATTGYVILPNSDSRPWIRKALRTTKQYLSSIGWYVASQSLECHRYDLDDDPTLMSATFTLERVLLAPKPHRDHWAGDVTNNQIPFFYGRKMAQQPYPKFIDDEGKPVYQIEPLSEVLSDYESTTSTRHMDIPSQSKKIDDS
jgi:N4-bis(aminopropyl)spermidine synthase